MYPQLSVALKHRNHKRRGACAKKRSLIYPPTSDYRKRFCTFSKKLTNANRIGEPEYSSLPPISETQSIYFGGRIEQSRRFPTRLSTFDQNGLIFQGMAGQLDSKENAAPRNEQWKNLFRRGDFQDVTEINFFRISRFFGPNLASFRIQPFSIQMNWIFFEFSHFRPKLQRIFDNVAQIEPTLAALRFMKGEITDFHQKLFSSRFRNPYRVNSRQSLRSTQNTRTRRRASLSQSITTATQPVSTACFSRTHYSLYLKGNRRKIRCKLVQKRLDSKIRSI